MLKLKLGLRLKGSGKREVGGWRADCGWRERYGPVAARGISERVVVLVELELEMKLELEL